MKYAAHLSKDKQLKRLIKEQGAFTLKKKKNLYLSLCFSIISQQLNTKVASIIKNRFLDLYKDEPSAQQILDTPYETLRSIGLSNAKVQYVQNVARFELEQGMSYSKLKKMENEEIILYLTQIKGVGRWTVEMLLMFSMGREDLFAIDDLGLRQAVIALYELKHRDKKKMNQVILNIAAKWTPYRTYACLYLWRWKDNTPTIHSKKK